MLTISGERKAEHEERKEGYYRVERSSGSFSRSLTLPEGVDPDAVRASFDRGVLEVRIRSPSSASRVRSRSTSPPAHEPETIEGSGRQGRARRLSHPVSALRATARDIYVAGLSLHRCAGGPP